MTADTTAMAAAAGVSQRTIERHRRAGCPLPRRGERLTDWVERHRQWRESRKITRESSLSANDNSKTDWAIEGAKELALKRRLEREALEGKFVPRDLVVAEWARRVFSVRQRLLALPNHLASKCAHQPPDVVYREAEELILRMLDEFCREGEMTPTPRNQSEATQTPQSMEAGASPTRAEQPTRTE